MKKDCDFCSQVLEEINEARKNPQQYSIKLRAFKANFKGLSLVYKNRETETQEGAAAYEEAAHFLDGMDSINGLNSSPLLHKAVQEALEQYRKTTAKIKEINVDEIITKYGDPHGEYANQLDYGSETPEMVVMNLLADDGDPSRANRDILLNPQFKVASIASGNDSFDGRVTVIFYATLYKELFKDKSKGKDKDKDKAKEEHEEEDFELPEGVEKIEREEKVIEENGHKKKVIKIIKTMNDGSVKTELIKETI